MTEPTEERPLVTFALFAYNQERFIREAVEGALAQTYSPLQVILPDDCSSDRTFEVTIPRQSRGLSFMSRSKRLNGVANAAPVIKNHLKVV